MENISKKLSNKELDKKINACFDNDYLHFLTILKLEGENENIGEYIYLVIMSLFLNSDGTNEELKQVKTTKDLFNLYIKLNKNNILTDTKKIKELLAQRLKAINTFKDKYLTKEESDSITAEIENTDLKALRKLAEQEPINSKNEYKGLTALEIYKSVYANYYYLAISIKLDSAFFSTLKDFSFNNHKNELVANNLVRRGVSAILRYREPKPSIKLNYEPNKKLTTLIGKKSRNYLSLVYAPLLPINNNTEIALYSGVEHDYNKRINTIAEKQKDLNKGSKEFNELENKKNALYDKRGLELKNIMSWEGIYYHIIGDYNAYLDKDGRYLLTKIEDGKEIKIARVLPRIWLNLSPIFYKVMYLLFLLATKRGGSFTLSYADIKELLKVDGDKFKNTNKEIKNALEQLSLTYLDMDKITLKNGEKIQPKGAMITASLIEKVGWLITFNEAYFKYLMSEEYANLINRGSFSEFNDRQFKLYTSITEYLSLNRKSHSKVFTYKVNRDYLLKYGGYMPDNAFNNLEPKIAKSRRNKEHNKLCKDLEIICSLVGDITPNRDNFLIINDINPKLKVFTIMDFYKENKKEVIADFIRCCEINNTPIRTK